MVLTLIRCPHCKTYRVGGPPCNCRENIPPVIIGEGSIDEQLRYAIKKVCGENRIILDTDEDPLPAQLPFPRGTRLFLVTSRSDTCKCTNPCTWVDRIFWLKERSVVVEEYQMVKTLIGNIVRQLESETP